MDVTKRPGRTPAGTPPSRLCVARLVAALLFAASLGQPVPLEAQGSDRPTLRAGRLTGELKLDGRLHESDWAEADSIPGLTEIEPDEGGVPTGRTMVKVLASRRELVFGVVAYDPEPARIYGPDMRRDAFLFDDDHIRIVLDPFLSGRSGLVFIVNPSGSRYDALITERGEDQNEDWDAIWDAATVRTDSGWSAEIWIPVRSLTFEPGLDRWGLNVQRRIQRLQEDSRWASPERDYAVTQTSRAGLLTNLPEFELGLGLSVRPFLTAGGGIPGPDTDLDLDEDQGFDITQRIGSNLQATLTVNTDFAQTEVDARQTNLSRFPLFFPEKREFFLQGSDIFDFGLGLSFDLIPFFSRRVGLRRGREVPIDVGGKLNGRLGATELGALVVRTGGVADLAPATTMGVVRVKQDILAESSLGAIATFGDPGGLGDAWLVGPDLTLQTSRFLGDRNFLVGLWALAMDREGLDGERTAAGLRLDYPNELWVGSVSYRRVGDAFRPSLGFVPRPGTHQLDIRGGHRPRPAWSLVRQMSFELIYEAFWTLDGELESWALQLTPLNWQLESGDQIRFNIVPRAERLFGPFEVAEDVILPAGSYDFIRYRLEGRIAGHRELSGRAGYTFGTFWTGRLQSIDFDSFWIPNPFFRLELSGEHNVGDLPEGDFTTNLVRARVRLNFSPDLQISSFIQYDDVSDGLGSNTRLRWTFRPQGDLFVVYNHNVRDSGKALQFDSNQLLFKIRHEFRF